MRENSKSPGRGGRRVRMPSSALPVLLVSLLLAACKEPVQWVRLGPAFAPEAPRPGQARVYVYWPPEGSPPGVYGISNDQSFQPLLPGGFTTFLVAPGTSHFKLQRAWDVDLVAEHPASASINVSEALQKVETARVYFLKVRFREGLLGRRPELAPVPPAVGQEEAQGCRRVVWKWEDGVGKKGV